MRFLCLCPTYKKPWSLIEQSISCFKNQTHKDKFLLIYDDLGALPEQTHDDWRVVSTNVREPDMITKYEKMLDFSSEHGPFDAVALWDDDDTYLPEHLAFHSVILQDHELSYPSEIWTTHNAFKEKNGRKKEESGSRFWASIGIRMEALKTHGFLRAKAVSFDLKNLDRWRMLCSTGDPCFLGDPTYVYRWEDTGCWHASWYTFAKFPEDEDWYERIGRH